MPWADLNERQLATLPRDVPGCGCIGVDHYNVFRYQGEAWEQIAHFNEQDVRALVAPMQFIGESQGHREYYRPTGA